MHRHLSLLLASAALALTGLLAAPRPARAQLAAAAQPPAKPTPLTPGNASDSSPTERPNIPKETLHAIRQRGTLRACIAPYAPWAIVGTDQSWSGFSIDITNQLAADLGVKPVFVPGGYGDLVQSLAEGDCDIIPSGLAPTPDRALFAHFSSPTTSHAVVIIADHDAGAGWRSNADLDKPEVTIGVVQDSIEAHDAKKAFPHATITPFPGQQELGEALASGKVKAVAAANPLSDILIKLGGEHVVLVPGTIGQRSEALAVRRGALEFLAYLNTWVLARSDDGWLGERVDHWFHDVTWAAR